MSPKSKIINNVRYITAKVAGKLVTISKASIRSDLLFNDADGIDSMHNQAIFDAIRLMGKVFSFMVKKGKHFSGNVTPLFDSMLVQPTEDEGEASERQFEPQPTPSPPHLSVEQHETQPDPSPRPSPTIPIPNSIPEGSGGNYGGQSSSDRSLSANEDGLTLQSVYDLCMSLCKQVTNQAKEIKHLKAQIKKLKKKAKPVITHHKAWMKSGRKYAKSKPIVHKDPAFDNLDDVDVNDAMDYIETDAYMQKGVSTDEPKDGTSYESTAPTTVFRDDETIAEFLVKRYDKELYCIGSTEDERQIKEMNKESKDPKKNRVVNETPSEEDTTKYIVSEIMVDNIFVSSCHMVSSTRWGFTLLSTELMGTSRAFNYLMDKRYSEIRPEGIELILWGDLKIMMESSTK
ncbi:hypothetical protein Tco_0568601 [Tanacetum coccineum]